jgi:hypothetical protein
MRSAIIMTTMLAMMAPAFTGEGGPSLPRLPEPKPEGYGVHLSKADRRGKSVAEIQHLRAERLQTSAKCAGMNA